MCVCVHVCGSGHSYYVLLTSAVFTTADGYPSVALSSPAFWSFAVSGNYTLSNLTSTCTDGTYYYIWSGASVSSSIFFSNSSTPVSAVYLLISKTSSTTGSVAAEANVSSSSMVSVFAGYYALSFQISPDPQFGKLCLFVFLSFVLVLLLVLVSPSCFR